MPLRGNHHCFLINSLSVVLFLPKTIVNMVLPIGSISVPDFFLFIFLMCLFLSEKHLFRPVLVLPSLGQNAAI